MLTYLQAGVLGSIQGISELFPVSSLGHSVILPGLLGWHLNQNSDTFLTFLVATHLATALVLLGFYWKEWVAIVKGMLRSLAERVIAPENRDGHIGWLLVAGSIPAGLLGLLFQDSLRAIFASPKIAAFCLILNGGVLYGAELLRRRTEQRNSDAAISRLGFGQSIGIGAAQAIALIPGFSRSGASMAGGLLVGLSNEEAARFAFLLATPIIFAAALARVSSLFSPANIALRGPAAVGAACAALTAYFSVRFLTRFFQTNRLTPFAIYCVLAGIVSLLIFAIRPV
jgi:undecaprenyl-diphosphatase